MKNFFCCLVTLTIFSIAQAQSKFSTGLRAGATLSTIEDVQANTRAGFYIGILGNIKFTKFYSLQPELNFTTQGANDVFLSSHYFPETNGGTVDMPLNYLGVAVMNKFNLKSFFLQVGPALELLMNDSLYTYGSADLSLNVGLGYDITNNLSVEGRYKVGVADVINDEYALFSLFQQTNYNSVFQLGLAYRFNNN